MPQLSARSLRAPDCRRNPTEGEPITIVPARVRTTLAACLTVSALLLATGCEDPTAAADPAPRTTGTPTKKPTGPRTDKATPDPAVTPAPTGKDSPTKAPPSIPGTALAALAALPVKGRAPMTGYDRDQFGTEWSDAVGEWDWSRNGCDTRNDVLARDLQRETVEANGCVVTSGVLAYEPYSGQRNYYFDKHDDEYSTDLDIEHIVALGNAWATGAQQLSPAKRAELANDPINLMAAHPSLNRSKGDADFATWLPPNKAFRCSYAARQIKVKTVYGLWVTAAEKAAMERVLATCPDEPFDQPDPQAGYTAAKVVAAPAAKPTPAPAAGGGGGKKPSSTGAGSSGSVYYANCDAARAAGAAPVRRGDPGYGSHLDRDGDGSGCE